MATFSSWYTTVPGTEVPVQDVFKEALDIFLGELAKDQTKREWIVNTNHGNFESVLQAVLDARSQYEKRKGDSKV
ncbi:hypothetical protein F4813DRAFT_372177 [Daldinia decipiens]|uniref:uncharacterized protein n=1 Tax=Daldinia decipiens TaxID=326647 RepID=UPI0020C3DF10|nr:uncharacterized protein F4813DRAFT_372177 [Daldinia decipiens]KAI1654076.1 hypothetical protein F4813DRAFT_372177 [Daldinia decipiens]